jgi:prepilin-type N-terminal cleavage/methylation domain-containing protein
VKAIRSCGTGGDGGNVRDFSAFTLIELLAVITILGIIAALSVPALKNLGKTNGQAGAARQLLDDVGRARQLAISQHTTVYMVFVPGQFWLPPYTGSSTWINSLSQVNYTNAVNLLDKQFTGYNFISLRSVGDQPGQGTPHYLSEWKSLPDGAFIAIQKFFGPTYSINNYPINSFNYANIFPFPMETNSTGVLLPYIAFNYLGQLTVDGVNLASQDEYIPLAQGVVGYAVDANKALLFAAPNATENPLGNSTNSMFDLVHIDRLTGRAEQLQQKVQ